MSNAQAPERSLWWAIGLALSVAVVNGFGRFAYALLLPPMRDELGWDYVLSGWLNTANSLGYGVGALLCIALLKRYRPADLFVAGLAITVLTLAACGFTHNLWTMMIWRFVSGIGSAWVFACGGALVAAAYSGQPTKAAAGIALLYAGGGLGVVLSGWMLAPVLAGGLGWSAGWVLLGTAGALLSAWPSWIALKVGGQRSIAADGAWRWQGFWPIMLAYFLFGAGYIVYLTFVVAWMRDMQLNVAQSVGVWTVLGLAIMASGPLWKGVMAHWFPTRTFAAACLVTGLGTALPIVSAHPAMLIASAMLVGGSFFMAPSAMMALARVSLPQSQWAPAMSLFTVVFALGQCVGPVVAGWIADASHLNWAMLAGALTLVAAAALSQAQGQRNG